MTRSSVRPLFDAHNHLHDERFGARCGELVSACEAVGVARMVVNGSCEADWPAVARLAQAHPRLVIPSFGCHPWYAHERSPRWEETLSEFLDSQPAAVGEIGLDRWKPSLEYAGQEELFIRQLQIAADRDLPASIHCLQAWGRMFDLMRSHARPARGFLLHSYGGPKEMVKPFAELGAYFSLPGYYAHARKQRQRDAFLSVPPDRLLLETDAPDQPLPNERNRHPLTDPATNRPLNHPANIEEVYALAQELFGVSRNELVAQIQTNFERLFGPG